MGSGDKILRELNLLLAETYVSQSNRPQGWKSTKES